jgi:hypothetical protein
MGGMYPDESGRGVAFRVSGDHAGSVAGAPVDEVPVQFRMPRVSPAVAEIEPPTVVTRDGKATAIFRSRSEGRFEVEITVAGYTETVYVTVLGDTPRF